MREKGWPKVSQMADSGKRLVLFSDKGGREDFGVMHGYDWTAENYWSMGLGLGPSDWSCYSRWSEVPLSKEEEKFRRLVVMNHFRDVPMAPTYETDNEKLRNRAERFCMPAARKKPNFLAIDQYKDGDPLSAVQAMNGYVYHGDTPGWGGTPAHWSVPRLAVMPLGDSITWAPAAPGTTATAPSSGTDWPGTPPPWTSWARSRTARCRTGTTRATRAGRSTS